MSIILLRIIPTTPRVGTDFRTDLTGLQIAAYDLTVQDNKVGVLLGTATFTTDKSTTIHQHFVETKVMIDVGPLPETRTVITWYSTATAVIVPEPPSGHLEYDTFDLRFEITREGQTILDDTIEYNVQLFSSEQDPNDYFKFGPSCYFQLPPASVGLSSTVASVQLNSNGQPPSFDTLHTAINIVLKQDHPMPSGTTLPNNSLETLSAPLTPGQAAQIASEITWNRTLNPPPTSTVSLQGIPSCLPNTL